jgi:hypothetical protein
MNTDTGAVRSGDCADVRYDLISPIGIAALARTYAEGAKKFGAFNWENGMPVADLLNHAVAHVYKWLGGDRSEDHLAHAAWGLLGAIHSLEKWPHLNQDLLRGENFAPRRRLRRKAVCAQSRAPTLLLTKSTGCVKRSSTGDKGNKFSVFSRAKNLLAEGLISVFYGLT